MIHLNISTPLFVQCWSTRNPNIATTIDARQRGFQQTSHRTDTDTIFVHLFVNTISRGFLLLPFPTVNDDDEELEMNEVVCILRMWSETMILKEQHNFTWNMLRNPPSGFACLLWKGVGTKCSEHSKPASYKWLRQKLAPTRLPGALLSPDITVSTEQAFVYRRQQFATESWFTTFLRQSLAAVYGNSSIHQVGSEIDLQRLLSFMFVTSDIAPSTSPLKFADCIMHNPVSHNDFITKAYHLLMQLIFTTWESKEMKTLQLKIVAYLGFPYVGCTEKKISILMIPFHLIQHYTQLTMPTVNYFGISCSAEQHSVLNPFETQLPVHITDLKTVLPFSSIPDAADPTFIFGNAHNLIAPELQQCYTFRLIDSSYSPVDNPIRTKENTLIQEQIGAPIPLDHIGEFAAHPMQVETLMKIDNYDHVNVQSELLLLQTTFTEAGYIMDTMFAVALNKWVVRIGKPKGYWT